jgi:predicted transcriptional regulator
MDALNIKNEKLKKAFKYIFGVKDRDIRLKLIYLLLVKGKIYSADLGHMLNVHQTTAHRTIKMFIALGLVEEKPTIEEKGIRPREGRYYIAADNQLVSELRRFEELICIFTGEVNPLHSTRS